MNGSTPSKLDPTWAVTARPPPGTGSVPVTTVPGGKGQAVGKVPSLGSEAGARLLMHDGVGESVASSLSPPHADVSARPSVARTSPTARDRMVALICRTS